MGAPKTYEGPITMTRKGVGFFTVGDTKNKADDLLIPPEWTNRALHGDTVRVAPSGMYRDPTGRMPPRASGKVLEVVKRARENFVGTLGEERGTRLLLPDYKKMHVPIVIEGGEAPAGYKVLVRMTGWKEGEEYPRGVIVEAIGPAGENETEMRALALGQGFASEFPPAVVAEAKELEKTGRARLSAGAAGRRDFRTVPTFTIDPADAKDFDDALSLRALAGGTFEIGIHIADVSFFVAPGSAIDGEARTRATSVYLVDRTIPMLPEILSNDLCSLRAEEDRLAVSAVFTLDTDAKILERWFGETVIRSNKRFTYEEAQGVLDAGRGMMHEELAILRALAKKIRAKRQAKGALDFDTAEVKVELDASGKPVAIRLKERLETNMLIEDFMLLANEAVAGHLAKLTNPPSGGGGLRFASLYRVHDAPDPERIENLALFLKVLGYPLETHGGKVSGAELNRLLGEVKGTPEEYLIKTATLRSMAKAVYTTKNIGHFGLAFEFYTHFTSPIRRYPDLLIHRLVKHHAGGQPISEGEIGEFDELALHASEREVAAAEAERDSVKLKQVEFLAPKIGQTFDAVISGVSDRGLYVEEKETRADGMVNIRDVGDDYFDYDERHYRLLGRRSKKVLQLGDPIRVRLVAARVPERELDFVPA